MALCSPHGYCCVIVLWTAGVGSESHHLSFGTQVIVLHAHTSVMTSDPLTTLLGRVYLPSFLNCRVFFFRPGQVNWPGN